MKLSRSNCLALVIALLSLSAGSILAQPMGTAFTYQGRLIDSGNPANGTYDLIFTLFNTNNGGNQLGAAVTNSPTTVSSGVFTVTLDFGGGVFPGINPWLQISVRRTGSNVVFNTLSPRQPILPTPYAVYAQSAGG